MIDLYNGELLNLLGPNYRADPEVQALSHALKQGMRVLLDHKDRATVYAGIDEAPEAALDLLAEELQVQYYEQGYDISIKRALIKGSLYWHQIAGTKAAVEGLAGKIFADCEVQEWMDYGGQPYHFRVVTAAPASADDVAVFNSLLSKVKNLRSHLDSVSILRSLESPGNHNISIRVTVAALPAISCIY